MRNSHRLLFCLMAVSSGSAGETDRALPAGGKGFGWESPVPLDCPFPRSPSLTGLFFTGRHSDYRCGDTFYPSWASDGNLYSPWIDGKTDGVELKFNPPGGRYGLCLHEIRLLGPHSSKSD